MQMQMSQLILNVSRVPAPNGSYMMMCPHSVIGTVPSEHSFSPVPVAPGCIYHHNPGIPQSTPSFGVNQVVSQPPSEPVDEMPSSGSNTPDDSDTGWNTNNATHKEVLCFKFYSNLFIVYQEPQTIIYIHFYSDTA